MITRKVSRAIFSTGMVVYFLISLASPPAAGQDAAVNGKPFGLVLHGGAGTISRENMIPELEARYRSVLREALRSGYELLKNGAPAPDVVEKVIVILEDDSLFNAGKGAVFTNAGTNELDASIMDGLTLNAGAVTGVQRIKNPIRLARLVMEKSPHVMLSGKGAETFGEEQGVKMVSPSYFHTQRRWQRLQEIREKQGGEDSGFRHPPVDPRDRYGTVGVAALDRMGNLAAGTSTGGMTNKRFGRIGDSPVIAAGTYANNKTCAVSATGHGEFFIRGVVAYDISALMEYGTLSLAAAADSVIMKKLTALGGTGGVVAIDRRGNIAMPFNTSGMYRGYADNRGNIVVKIYRDE